MTQSAAPSLAADGAFQEAPKLPESFALSGSGFVEGEIVAEQITETRTRFWRMKRDARL
jgi:hypothetical protein